jgi:hypothetical protein
MRLAVASKSKHWETWSALRAAGLPIISTWPEWSHNRNGDEPDADAWREHSAACIDDAVNADILLLYWRASSNSCSCRNVSLRSRYRGRQYASERVACLASRHRT